MATPVWIDGAEHGVATLVTSGAGLFDAVNGSPSTQSTTKNTGTYAYQFNTSATTAYLQKNFASNQTTVVGRLYFRYGTLPNSRTEIVMHTGSVISGPRFMFLNTDAKIYIAFGSTGGTASTGTFTTGQWYRLDWRIVISGTTGTIDWQIDGTAQTQHVDTGLASGGAMSQTRIGFVTSTTGNMYIDDCVISYTSADYPLGPGGTEWLAPTGEGTHSIAANTLEDAAGSDINGTSVLAYAQIDELPISESTTRIQQNGADNNSYFEVTLADISATHSAIIGGMAYLAYMSASATANNGGFTASKDSFSTETTVWGSKGSLADYSESSMFYKSAIVAGVTDDTTTNALKFRGGWSSDATPDPYWYNAGVQLAYSTSSAIDLVTADVSSTSQADNVALTQVHNVVMADASATTQADNVALTQVHNLIVADASATSQSDNVTISIAIPLTTADASAVTQADNVDLTQVHNLIVADASAVSQADSVTLTQTHNLSVADGSATTQADNIDLSGSVTLEMADGSATTQADNVTLTQVHNLAVGDGFATTQADVIDLSGSVTLDIADGFAVSQADSVIITQTHVLGIADAASVTQADNVDLAQTYVLAVADGSATAQADNIDLAQVHNLVAADAYSVTSAPNVTITDASNTLIIADGYAETYADAVVILKYYDYDRRYKASARRDVSVEARTTHEAGTRRDQAAEEREDKQAKPRRTFKSDGL